MENFSIGDFVNEIKKLILPPPPTPEQIAASNASKVRQEILANGGKAPKIPTMSTFGDVTNQIEDELYKKSEQKFYHLRTAYQNCEDEENLYNENKNSEMNKDNELNMLYTCDKNMSDTHKKNFKYRQVKKDYNQVINIFNLDKDNCAKKCNDDDKCIGFSINNKNCILKSAGEYRGNNMNKTNNNVKTYEKELITPNTEEDNSIRDFKGTEGFECDVATECSEKDSADCQIRKGVCESTILKNINSKLFNSGDSTLLKSQENIKLFNNKLDKINNDYLETNDDIKRQIGVTTNELLIEQKKYELKNRVVNILRNIIITLIVLFVFMLTYHFFDLSKYKNKLNNMNFDMNRFNFFFNNNNNNNNNNSNNNNNYNKNRNNNNIKRVVNRHGLN